MECCGDLRASDKTPFEAVRHDCKGWVGNGARFLKKEEKGDGDLYRIGDGATNTTVAHYFSFGAI